VIVKGGGRECVEAAAQLPEVETIARKTLKMLDGEMMALMVDAALPKGLKKLAHIDPLGLSSNGNKTRQKKKNTVTADDHKEKRPEAATVIEGQEEGESGEAYSDDHYDQGSGDRGESEEDDDEDDEESSDE
jgi:hypothetical protein